MRDANTVHGLYSRPQGEADVFSEEPKGRLLEMHTLLYRLLKPVTLVHGKAPADYQGPQAMPHLPIARVTSAPPCAANCGNGWRPKPAPPSAPMHSQNEEESHDVDENKGPGRFLRESPTMLMKTKMLIFVIPRSL